MITTPDTLFARRALARLPQPPPPAPAIHAFNEALEHADWLLDGRRDRRDLADVIDALQCRGWRAAAEHLARAAELAGVAWR